MEMFILYAVMMFDTWRTIFKITSGISVFVFFYGWDYVSYP